MGITTASIDMLDIQTGEPTDVLMDGMVAIVTFLVFLDKKRVVWTVKEHFVVEKRFLNLRNLVSSSLISSQIKKLVHIK